MGRTRLGTWMLEDPYIPGAEQNGSYLNSSYGLRDESENEDEDGRTRAIKGVATITTKC